MNTSRPLVTVVMATLNRASRVRTAVDSVLAQDYPAFELVIVNDGSTDPTAEVLSGLAGDPRVRVVTHEKNQGLPASLNRGIATGHGDLIARIDDDDTWVNPTKLTQQVGLFSQQPRLGLVGTAYVDEQGEGATNPLSDGAIRAQMLFRCPFCHSSVMMRRTAFEQAGGYDESLPYAEDWDLWLRIGRDWDLANQPDVMVARHRGESTLSEQYFERQLGMASGFAGRYASDYPRATLARLYHAGSRGFFRCFPVGGSMHRGMQKLFSRAFSLRRGNDG
ncbi:glycosyltransferase [Marinihelvus fidelis]|uniref:Glycosyltransferase n=1 Tax=Marinihelvus fidelis TaxID=2613842 RepID=A0A5N0TE96_9GAMM|nr:glycosyltransferase [Marinihelvus fidelis]KAA9133362.1 glycosyltransferase [Marinihelvus fidelis]